MSIDQTQVIGVIDAHESGDTAVEVEVNQEGVICILDLEEIEMKVIEVGFPGMGGDGENNAFIFKNVVEMQNYLTLTEGSNVQTLGYYQPNDSGGAHYLICASNEDVNGEDIPWAIVLKNGLYALINEQISVTYRMFGARLDGIEDDAPAMLFCHKYADALFTYDETGRIKQYPCRVENHQGTIYKKGTDAITCCSDVDLSGSTLLVDDTNATWFGIYVWGDVNALYYDYEIPDDMKESFESDNFVIKMPHIDQLPPNTVLKIEEDPYSARDDAGYLYTVARRELLTHAMNGICTSPLTDDWTHAGGEEINCPVSDLTTGTTTTMQAFTRLKASYTYIPNIHGTFTGCAVQLNVSANKYCSVMWCKRHNATIQNFVFRPRQNALHNTKFKNTMIYLWDSYNVTVRNLQGFNAAGQRQDNKSGTSGYMLRITNCADVHIEDCQMQGYWGATAMDSVKNIFFTRCHINRLDIHDYFSNLFADQCTFYNHSIQIGYGRGMASFTNSSFLYNDIADDSYASSHLVEFNLTYGRVFEGKVYIDNCRVVTKKPPDNEFNIFKMEFSPSATAITKHFKFPEVTCKNLYIQSNDPNTHYAYFKIAGTRRAATSTIAPSHVYGVSNDGTVTWQYYGRGINWGADVTAIKVDDIVRIVDTFLDTEKKTQFYNYRYYICTKGGALNFSTKPTNTDDVEFTNGTAKLKYIKDAIWQSKHAYTVGDICAANPSNFYPLYLFRCIKAGTSNGYFPTHATGTILEGTNDPVNEPDECWWTYKAQKTDWCIDWAANMTVTKGQRIIAEGRIYEVIKTGLLTNYPPYDTAWFGKSLCGTAELKFIGATWTPHAWYAKESYCAARGNIYQLAKHDGTTSGTLPTRGNPYCVDGDIIWEYKDTPRAIALAADAIPWEASKRYDIGTTLKAANRLYEVQSGTTGSSQPTDTTTGKFIMDGSILVECLGEHAIAWRVAGNSYNAGDIIIDNTFVVKCMIAGQTNINNRWGPTEGAAWTNGIFTDGTCVWQKVTQTAADGVWRSSYSKYKVGMIFLCDSGATAGKVRLYRSMAGISGTTPPTDTSGSIFLNGYLALKYTGAAGGDTWQENSAYNQGDTVIANNNTYTCVFDGKMVLPRKTIFEDITTNMLAGHVFWFCSGTNVPTKQESPWKIIIRNCDAVDGNAEGIAGETPYFCHDGNVNPTIVIQ